MEDIKGFQGQHRFLSNFYPCKIDFEGRTYWSSEAAYQASKSEDEETKEGFTTLNARQSRTLGKEIQSRKDWDSIKLNVMYRILRAKFSREPQRSHLLDTEDAYLEETNYWHDRFWGIYNGEGLNHLGRLLMLVRDELVEGII